MHVDEDDLALPLSTLAALTSFLEEQSVTQDALAALNVSQPMSLPDFKRIFKENWQLSQFWYTEDTADRLSHALVEMAAPGASLAFLCCPTGYVAFKQKALPTQTTLLLEYDTRFAIFAGPDFVHYDLDEPLSFSGREGLKGSQDVLVIDPPFHAETSQRKLAATAAHLLRPGGCVVLLTGTALSPAIDDIYAALPPLQPRDMLIEHDGVGRLATPYACWVGGGLKMPLLIQQQSDSKIIFNRVFHS